MTRLAAFWLGLLVAALVAAGPAIAAKPTAEAVRIGVHPDKTRFVLELSDKPSYRVFILPDPVRVVIDLPELDWRLPAQSNPSSQGLISTLRYGLFAPGTSRVVLDMTGPVGLKSVSVLPAANGAGHRLIVDIAASSRVAFEAGEGRGRFVSDPPLPQLRQVALPVVPKLPSARGQPTIVIDPGHGGVDPGAIGVLGTYEKDLALDYGRELKKQLEATGRYRVVLTRDRDVFLRLRDRFAIAQKVDGDLFLSLHANTVAQDYVRGASVYTLSEKSSDAEAAALARKENLSDIIAGVNFSDHTEDVSKILIDLAQRETMNLSKDFANTLVKALGRRVKLLRNTHRYAGFAVLKSPTVPSVLVEVGYISNATEERLLRSPGHRAKVGQAILEAIDSYFDWQEGLRRS
ncbi:MAG: N-acetylmuramoyl-L-alanine amidase [Kiloniellales bacterium]|nr:N-acetylmuramoyl-L-alanine amidase [Kiloniellales bacterium]